MQFTDICILISTVACSGILHLFQARRSSPHPYHWSEGVLPPMLMTPKYEYGYEYDVSQMMFKDIRYVQDSFPSLSVNNIPVINGWFLLTIVYLYATVSIGVSLLLFWFHKCTKLIILVPIALFLSLSWRGPGTRIEGLWRYDFPVLDSKTSGLHVNSQDVSIYCMGVKMAAVEAGFEERFFRL